jgi:predicted urease superfamily metal-dependent hydrolase
MIEQEIDGVPHVTVPKELWDRMWEVFDKIENIGEGK